MVSQKSAKSIALQRIRHLFQEAKEAFKTHPERSNRYVTLARKIAMKARISIPKPLRKNYCKHCYTYFQQGVNCRVRVRNDLVIYYCRDCKRYTKHPYGKKLKKS